MATKSLWKEFGESSAYQSSGALQDPSWWQRLFSWELPRIDICSPLRPEELTIKGGGLTPDWWQKLMPWRLKEGKPKFGRDDGLAPAWWQRIFWWMARPKPAPAYQLTSQAVEVLQRQQESSLKPALWQRPFCRRLKLN